MVSDPRDQRRIRKRAPFYPRGAEKSARAFAGMRTHSPLARRKRGVRGHSEGRVRQELRAHQSQLQSEHFQRLLRPCRGISRHRAERGIYRGAHRQGTPLIGTERIRPTAENSVRRGGKRYARGGVFRRTGDGASRARLSPRPAARHARPARGGGKCGKRVRGRGKKDRVRGDGYSALLRGSTCKEVRGTCQTAAKNRGRTAQRRTRPPHTHVGKSARARGGEFI